MSPENPFRGKEPSPPVPEGEMDVTFVRSSGPGGQKVNKTSSKAVVRWNVDASPSFSDEEKARIRERCVVTKEGDIIVASSEERSQLQNRIDAVAKLQRIVSAALEEEKERVATTPTRGSKERRISEKKRRGKTKEGRRGHWGE
ncbi:aminoacyl-tRNA hydrolase, partial [Candidatus Uhrbacteria bacterium]|nr:aminoacyl-tRNA hydrolase [Candidatus Uhrbacteria bacterium]